MISCYLLGGLGNQMFQIAATYSLAKEMGVDYMIDFDMCHTPAQGHTSNKYKDNIFKNINNGKPKNIVKQYNESKFSYTELPKEDNLILRGYFQSEKYFTKNKEDIKNLFHFDDEIMKKTKHFLTSSISEHHNITAIHVRRGDYLKNPGYHPTCSVEYYQKAIETLDDGNMEFVFISDDLEWCKENFKGDNIHYSPFTNEIDDLHVLVQCDNHIISNSSFSWWGAYLSKTDNKVITPKTWFGPNGPQDTQDIYLKDWLKM